MGLLLLNVLSSYIYIIGSHIVSSIVSLLVSLAFGVGLLWLVSYIYVSMAKFYDDIKKD